MLVAIEEFGFGFGEVPGVVCFRILRIDEGVTLLSRESLRLRVAILLVLISRFTCLKLVKKNPNTEVSTGYVYSKYILFKKYSKSRKSNIKLLLILIYF